VVKKMLGVPVFSQFADCWRPFAALLAMFDVMQLSAPYLPVGDTIPALLAQIILGTGIGAASYVASLLIFWLASGQPSGIEATAGRIFMGLLNRFGFMRLAAGADGGES
jgi:hypothetical protein